MTDRKIECPVHGTEHGAEAEELRKGIEHILNHAGGSRTEIANNLRDLLDRVDARDSLACLETIDQLKARIAELLREEAKAAVQFLNMHRRADKAERTVESLSASLVKIERDASVLIDYDEQRWRASGCPTFTSSLQAVIKEAQASLAAAGAAR